MSIINRKSKEVVFRQKLQEKVKFIENIEMDQKSRLFVCFETFLVYYEISTDLKELIVISQVNFSKTVLESCLAYQYQNELFLLVASSHAYIQVFQLKSDQQFHLVEKLPGHKNKVKSIKKAHFKNQDIIISVSLDNYTIIWNMHSKDQTS